MRWAPGGPLPDAGKVYTGSAQLPVPQLGRCAPSAGRSLPEAGKVCIGHRRDRDALAGGPLPEAGRVSFGSVRNYSGQKDEGPRAQGAGSHGKAWKMMEDEILAIFRLQLMGRVQDDEEQEQEQEHE